MKTISSLMTRDVVTISSTLTLREAAVILSEREISGAPVVDSTGALVGMLSESDLLNEARKRAALPRTAVFGLLLVSEETLQRLYHFGADLPVSQVMTKNIITITEKTSLHAASQLLVQKKINRLPVVDDSGALLGIVTREDLLKAVFAL
jgi:CBS domain-containing protein